MIKKVRTKRSSPARSQHQGTRAHGEPYVSRFGANVFARGYARPLPGASSVLADLVESMADSDAAYPSVVRCARDPAALIGLNRSALLMPQGIDGVEARPLAFNCIPGTALCLVIHYRTPMLWWRQHGDRSFALPDCRHFVTRHQTGVIVVQPSAPLGTVNVRLRPEAAAVLLGGRLQCFLDATVDLEDIFGAGQVSRLAQMLAEAATSAERFACVERFLAANVRARRAEPVECRAAALLRRNPQLRVRHLAPQLGVSERQLSRRFQAMFGVSPKQFARLARIERVWSAWTQGASWADIAHAAGFTDQAHMIKDFTGIVGMPPAQLARWHSSTTGSCGDGPNYRATPAGPR